MGGSTAQSLDASMDLLNQIVRQPLDPDYAVVAARGEPPAAQPGRAGRWWQS